MIPKPDKKKKVDKGFDFSSTFKESLNGNGNGVDTKEQETKKPSTNGFDFSKTFQQSLKKKEVGGNVSTDGLPEPISTSQSQLPLQNGKEIFGFDKFSEFKKPELDPKQQRVPEWKPTTLAEAHTEDKNWSGNLWNKFVGGYESIAETSKDFVINAMAAVLPESVLGGKPEEVVKLYRTDPNLQVTGKLTKAIGANVTEQEKENFEEGFISSSVGGLAGSLAAITSPKGTKVAALFFQGYDGGLKSINASNEADNLDEGTKTIFAGTVGAAQAALEKYGLDKIFGKISDRVATNLAVTTLRGLMKNSNAPITAEVFEQALTGVTKELKKKLIDAGGKIGSASLIEFTTGTGQELSTVVTEIAANKLTGKPVFEDASWKEYLGRIAYAGAQESVGGGILGTVSVPFSKTRNYIAEKVADAKTTEDINTLKTELMNVAANQQLSQAEVEQINKTIDDYARVNLKIPTDIPNKKEVADKILDRENIQNEVDLKEKEIVNVDDAFKEGLRTEIAALRNRAQEINEEILQPVTTEETITEPAPDNIVQGTPENISQPVELSTEVEPLNDAKKLLQPHIDNPALAGYKTEEEKIKFIAEQSQNVTDGIISPYDNKPSMIRNFGEPLVNAAIEVHPLKSLLKNEQYDQPTISSEQLVVDNTPDNISVPIGKLSDEVAKKEDESLEDVKGVSSNQKNIGDEVDTPNGKAVIDRVNKNGGVIAKLTDGSEILYTPEKWGTQNESSQPKLSNETEIKTVSDALKKHDEVENYTFHDMVNDVDHIANESGNPKLIKALEDYRKAAEDDAKLGGRGDMDTAEKEFVNAVKEQEPIKDKAENNLFHSSKTGIENIPEGSVISELGIHLGSKETADKISEVMGGTTRQYQVDIKNPIEVPDFARWEAFVVSRKLKNDGIITDKEYEQVNKQSGNDKERELLKILKSKGYDGFVYDNAFEGGGKSYVAFDKSQVKAAPSTVKDNTKKLDKLKTYPGSIHFVLQDLYDNTTDKSSIAKEVSEHFKEDTPANKSNRGSMIASLMHLNIGIADPTVEKLAKQIQRWVDGKIENDKLFDQFTSTVKDKGSGVVDDLKDISFSRLDTHGEENIFVIEKNGNEIGRATLSKDGDYLENIRVDEKYRRQGLGTKLYDFIENKVGIELVPSPNKQSPSAKSFWEKRNLQKSVSNKANGGLLAKALNDAIRQSFPQKEKSKEQTQDKSIINQENDLLGNKKQISYLFTKNEFLDRISKAINEKKLYVDVVGKKDNNGRYSATLRHSSDHKVVGSTWVTPESKGELYSDKKIKELALPLMTEQMHKDSVELALKNKEFSTDISDGRMTANDAKTIIESAGLKANIFDYFRGDDLYNQLEKNGIIKRVPC